MGLYRVRTVITGLSGAPYLSTIFFYDSTTSQTTANAAATKVVNFWTAGAARMVNTTAWAVQSSVDELDTAGNLTAFWTASTATNGAGSGTGSLAPTAVQGLLRIETGQVQSGRRVRGRIFLPGVNNSDQTNGSPSATYRSSWNTAANSLLAAGAPRLVVWSRAHAVAIDAVSASTQGYFAVLRSRRD